MRESVLPAAYRVARRPMHPDALEADELPVQRLDTCYVRGRKHRSRTGRPMSLPSWALQQSETAVRAGEDHTPVIAHAHSALEAFYICPLLVAKLYRPS